jgi:hypothetical protein
VRQLDTLEENIWIACIQTLLTQFLVVQVVSQYSSLLAPLAVDAVTAVLDTARPNNIDLRDIRVLKKLGGTVSGNILLAECFSVVEAHVWDFAVLAYPRKKA